MSDWHTEVIRHIIHHESGYKMVIQPCAGDVDFTYAVDGFLNFTPKVARLIGEALIACAAEVESDSYDLEKDWHGRP